MKKKEKAKKEENALAKLVNLTKMIKTEKVKIEPKGFMRSPNKWRQSEPKFNPKPEKEPKPEGLVQAGGMEVDPARALEYENWRKDKEAEQAERRIQSQRKWEAVKKARAALRNLPPGI